jgi:hypothetical protein
LPARPASVASRIATPRLVADLLRLSLTVGPVVLAIDGKRDYAMVFIAVTAWALRAARAPALLDLGFVTLLAADAWATELGAFHSFNRDDHVGHALLAGFATPLVYLLVRRLGVLRSPPPGLAPRVAFALTLFGLGLALGAAWELVEYACDSILGTNYSLGYSDTMGDLVADAVGAGVAAVLVSWRLSPRG